MLLDANVSMTELQRALGRRDLRFLIRFNRHHDSDPSAEARLRIWEHFVGERPEADLLDQAGRLLDDPTVDPTAAVVLTSAALEEFLRSLVRVSSAELKSRPSITAYAEALRSAGVLDAREVRTVGAWAALRNGAVHRDGTSVSRRDAENLLAEVRDFCTRHRETG